MTVAMAGTNLGAPVTGRSRDAEDGASGGWLLLLGAASLGVHAALFSALGIMKVDHQARPRSPVQVTMEVAHPRAPASPKPLPLPAEQPHPRAAIPKAKVAPRLERRAPPSAPPEAETPADLSGVTLTNEGNGAAWASAIGNGAAMRAPVGAAHAKVTTRVVAAPAPPAEPLVVPLASLSRPPAPPDLSGMLERHYPEAARQTGQAGQAVLKARILRDGRARDLVIVSESAPGFGDACRATLRDSEWTPPLDREGQPVATLVNYTCRFEVK